MESNERLSIGDGQSRIIAINMIQDELARKSVMAFAKEQNAPRIFKWYYRRRVNKISNMEFTLVLMLANIRKRMKPQ